MKIMGVKFSTSNLDKKSWNFFIASFISVTIFLSTEDNAAVTSIGEWPIPFSTT